MNYIWEVFLKAERQAISKETIRFIPAKRFSPYLEAAFTDLNTKDFSQGTQVEVNALYRFEPILGRLIDINLPGYPQLREAIFDVILHYLAILDLKQGYSKNEYYHKFVLNDFRDGVYGQQLRQDLKAFSKDEVREIISGLLILYKTGTSVFLFKKVIHLIYPDSIVYENNDRFRELLIYIGKPQNTHEEGRLTLLLELFLPLDYQMHIFWTHHFGIIDVEETLIIDDMELF